MCVYYCGCDAMRSVKCGTAHEVYNVALSSHTQSRTKENKKAMKMQTWAHTRTSWQITIHQKNQHFLFWICGRWPKLKCSLLMSLNLFLWHSFVCLSCEQRMSCTEEYLKEYSHLDLEIYVCRFWNIAFSSVINVATALVFEPVNVFAFLWATLKLIHDCHSFNTMHCDKNSKARMVFQKRERIKWI